MSSSVSLGSLKNIHSLVLPVGTLSTSIESIPSSEGVLTASGEFSEGLGLGLSALRRATSIFGICTRYVIGARRSMGACCCRSITVSIDDGLLMSIDDGVRMLIDFHVDRAGRMWEFCYELVVSHDPYGFARCG
ncbi:hypothetical protein F2Q68_00015819 [Brassica cretica]|uniref:Uncharacterized protein n=1 Tax=Brassica cretica TaxID=69181 RepID=A0A8S9HN55_BRACR|nr:hypothetical protein F2Q68_00015819 [Brassica cretica]